MNTVRCPNCHAENAVDLNFCTNCGAALPAAEPSTLVQTAAAVNSQPVASASPARATGGIGKNLAIFGGLGCIALALGGVALIALLYYVGSTVSNADQANSNAAVNVNRQTTVRANVNFAANAAATDDEQTSAEEAEMYNLMPERIGAFGRMGSAVKGGGDDFINAKIVLKATYAKNRKQLLNVTDAEFADAKAAETAYTIFLYGTRAGAKITKQQKIKDAKGIEGDSAVYTFKQDGETLHEAMFYGGKYAFRFTAPDQATLTEFLTAFGEHSQTISR